MKKSTKAEMSRTDRVCTRGFSLLELLVATAVFLLVSGVAFTLFTRHQAVLNEEQLTVGLNIGLRNALAQIQLDVANAGNGLILGTNVASWPVGVTIVNNPNPSTAACNPTNLTGANPPVYVYQNSCFDQLNVIVVDPNTPAINPCAGTGCTVSTSAGTTANGPVPRSSTLRRGTPLRLLSWLGISMPATRCCL